MLSIESLNAERIRLQLAANAGLSMPVAGMLVWAALGGAVFVLDYQTWMLTACMALGMIFPIAILLQKPLRSPFFKAKSALNGVLAPAVITANLHWPVTVMIIQQAPELFPVAFGLSTAPIWAVVGWQYKSVVGYLHLALRVPLVVAAATAITDPALACAVIAFGVAAVYLTSAIAFAIEVGGRRRAAEPAIS
ncbi:MAG: hypothetical protein RIA71_13350 [Oceanicaulis sp.]